MPQIWMTYEEVGCLLEISAHDARTFASSLSLDRKRSRDGRTRVKLDAALTALFCARVRESDVGLDLAVEQLRSIHEQMTGFSRTTRRSVAS